MSAFESVMWRLESDPRLRSPMVAVELLDTEPDWDRLYAAHDWGTRLVPRFRERVVEPPLGLGRPVWAVDPNFDLHYHLRRVRLPKPGSFDQVLELAEKAAMTPFDPARPPCEAILVEGLEGGQAAYVLKVHHSATDGLGGIQLLGMLHSRQREPMADKPQPPPPEPERPASLSLLAEQVGRRALDAARGAVEALGMAGRLAARPDAVLTDAARFAGSLGRMLGPPPAPPSPLLRGRSLSWRFGVHEMPLDELKAAAKAGGGSLNDAYLAALLGGLRRYHDEFGVEIDELPIAIPISVRRGDHPMGGNRFAGARFAAPIGVRDPRERIELIREFVLGARAEPALDALNLIAPVMNALPAPLLRELSAGLTGAQDVQATNVPGIPYPVYMAGAQITRMYPFGPLPGCAVMAGLVSHSGTCCIGVNVDAAAVTDLGLFMDCLREGFDEVLALRPARAASGVGQ